MKLSLDALRMLDVIEAEGSFAAAARRLHRVPSALTHAIRRLEDDLGYPLFERQGRRAVLTRAGQTLLDDGRTLLRAASELECRAKRMATGWESMLRICLDAVVDFDAFLPLVSEFLEAGTGTRLAIEREVLGGTWDALVHGRADLIIGATGEPALQAGLASVTIGTMELVFCVAPHHPLAAEPDPLPTERVSACRAIVMADTSRQLPARSVGLLEGQDTLVVPDFAAKLAALRAGLGVGYLAPQLAYPAIARGELVEKRTASPHARTPLRLAWRSAHHGHALAWFLERLQRPLWRERLGASAPESNRSDPARSYASSPSHSLSTQP
jgi:DNA-binding transcriptional LysR family regulator